MRADTTDMTQGDLRRQILFFSLPLMASNLLQVLFNMADVAIVGRYAGSSALGSVGSTVTLIGLFTGFLIGIGSGVNALVARYIGARDRESVTTSVHTALLVMLVLSAVLMGGCLTLGEPLLRLLGTKAELLDGAVLYFRLCALGMPALAVYNHGNAVLSAAGDTRTPLMYLTFAGVVNVILNVAFVLGLHMSVDGVAWATVISQYLSAALIVRKLIRSDADYTLRRAALHFERRKAGAILALGIPAGLQSAIFSIANLFIQASVNSFNAATVSGNAAATNSDNIIWSVTGAVYAACATFIAQNFGARRKERIMSAYRISLVYSLIACTVMSVGFVVFGRQFLALFTTDAAVVEAGMARLVIMSFSAPTCVFMDCSMAASRGLGESLGPTVILILGSCVFRIIWVYTVFAYFHTMEALYLLYLFSWVITGAAQTVYFAKAYKRQMALIKA